MYTDVMSILMAVPVFISYICQLLMLFHVNPH